jgi:hypothetical protein
VLPASHEDDHTEIVPHEQRVFVKTDATIVRAEPRDTR